MMLVVAGILMLCFVLLVGQVVDIGVRDAEQAVHGAYYHVEPGAQGGDKCVE